MAIGGDRPPIARKVQDPGRKFRNRGSRYNLSCRIPVNVDADGYLRNCPEERLRKVLDMILWKETVNA
ncbi:Protein of unknown function [Gryllus bimaculatus]|nr:Protein of unknown function [Gryllus bimaculatus]